MRHYVKIDFSKIRTPDFVSICGDEGTIAAAINRVSVTVDAKADKFLPRVELAYWPLDEDGHIARGTTQVKVIEGYLLTKEQADEYDALKLEHRGIKNEAVQC